jgi:hypothetical protein
MADTHPTDAHYENGVWIHDPLNMPLAEHEKLGNLGARDLGQLEHITSIQGYCEHGKLGGCPKD